MAIVIEDPEIIEQIERLAAGLKVSPVDIVRAAVSEKSTSVAKALEVHPQTFERRLLAIREAQEWFRTHGSKDTRSADDIIGYNELGHFD